MADARAYVYNGDWVADCPRDGCANAEHLFGLRYPQRPQAINNSRDVRLAAFCCSNCQQLARIDWPPDGEMAEITEVLNLRPVPQNRNWYPQDHPGAVSFRIPHGLSVDDLRRENADHGVSA
jgi:hypothetical protein